MRNLSIAVLILAVGISTAKADINSQLELPEFTSGKTVWAIKVGININKVSGSATGVAKEMWAAEKKWGDEGWQTANYTNYTSYDVTAMFTKSFGQRPMYWGMELTFGSRGYGSQRTYNATHTITASGPNRHTFTMDDAHTESLKEYNVQFSPFTFGYRYTFFERMAVDIHLGVYAEYDFAGISKIDIKDIAHYTFPERPDFNKTTDKSNSYEMKFGDEETPFHKFDAGIKLGVGYWFGHFNFDFTWQRGFVPYYDNGDDKVKIGSGKKAVTKKRGNFYANGFILRLGYSF